MCVENDGSNVYNVDASNGLDKGCIWNCRLGHINQKRITQIKKDELLELFYLRLDDESRSCFLGKMTKSSFTRICEKGEGL